MIVHVANVYAIPTQRYSLADRCCGGYMARSNYVCREVKVLKIRCLNVARTASANYVDLVLYTYIHRRTHISRFVSRTCVVIAVGCAARVNVLPNLQCCGADGMMICLQCALWKLLMVRFSFDCCCRWNAPTGTCQRKLRDLSRPNSDRRCTRVHCHTFQQRVWHNTQQRM